MLINFFQVSTELHNQYTYRKKYVIIFNDLCIKEKISFMIQFDTYFIQNFTHIQCM